MQLEQIGGGQETTKEKLDRLTKEVQSLYAPEMAGEIEEVMGRMDLEDIEKFISVYQSKKEWRNRLEDFIITHTPGFEDNKELENRVRGMSDTELEHEMLPVAKNFSSKDPNETVILEGNPAVA